MRQAQHMIHPGHIVVGFFSQLQERRALALVVVYLEEGDPLHHYVGSVLRLSLDGVLDVAEADGHVDHFVVWVEGVGAEEVVCV